LLLNFGRRALAYRFLTAIAPLLSALSCELLASCCALFVVLAAGGPFLPKNSDIRGCPATFLGWLVLAAFFALPAVATALVLVVRCVRAAALRSVAAVGIVAVVAAVGAATVFVTACAIGARRIACIVV
jgi:hypothetical protein